MAGLVPDGVVVPDVERPEPGQAGRRRQRPGPRAAEAAAGQAQGLQADADLEAGHG